MVPLDAQKLEEPYRRGGLRGRTRPSLAVMGRSGIGATRPLVSASTNDRFPPRLWENSDVQFTRRKSFSTSVNLKINNARQRYREEAIEKTILRILAS